MVGFMGAISAVKRCAPFDYVMPVPEEAELIQPSHFIAETPSVSAQLDQMVALEGSGAHPYIQNGGINEGPAAMRNLADAVHFLCILHGRFPAIIDHAARIGAEPSSMRWMDQAAEAFSQERRFLAQMTTSLGPAPSTADQLRSETAVAAQCRALDMMAQSERRGCALGAAITLMLEWRTLRALLDISAERMGLTPLRCLLPDLRTTARIADQAASNAAIERAMMFGAQQLLIQHRSLWDLLSARAASRSDV